MFVSRHRLLVDLDPGAQARTRELQTELTALRAQLDTDRERSAAMLTTIRSVFTRSIVSGGTVEAIAEHFDARLEVLARYQRNASGAHDLEMMIRDELREFQFGEDPRITIAGRVVWLDPSRAQLLGLALHELSVNALKFGALSRAEGQLHIVWGVVAGELRLDWSETGVAMPCAAVPHYGVGRELIEQALPAQLNARTSFDVAADGVRCLIAFSLAQSGAILDRPKAAILHDRVLLQ